jgi:biopolymer transport protein ExbD
MADVNSGGDDGGKKGKKKRPKKGSTRIDMTPMVDLAFLLLTFFILATTLSKPKTMEIVYPKKPDKDEKPMPLNYKLANTILLGDKEDQVFYYAGKFKGGDSTTLEKIDFSKDGIRKLLLDKNKNVNDVVTKLEGQLLNHQINDSTFKSRRSKAKGDSLAPFFIVKTVDHTKYKTVIDIIDEMNIANAAKYAVVDMADAEKAALSKVITK